MGADLRRKVFSKQVRNNNELMAFERISEVKGGKMRTWKTAD